MLRVAVVVMSCVIVALVWALWTVMESAAPQPLAESVAPADPQAAALLQGPTAPPEPAPFSLPPQAESDAPDAAASAAADSRPDGRPNIVLIILDTLRADRVGYMNPELPAGVSPQIDAFARGGVRFERAIAQASWTRPSIGSLLTSRYPRTLGIYREKWDPLPREATTLAEALGSAGYRTVGLTANPNLNRTFDFHQGFDVYIDSAVVFGWMGANAAKGERLAFRNPLRPAREIFQLAGQLVQHAHAGPTYLQINVMEMHEAARDDLFRPGYLSLFQDHPNHRYLSMLRLLSDDLGAFIRELSQRDGWRDTIFVVTSDHGEGLDSHPDVADSESHGLLLYESQCWVPLFLYHPGDRLPHGVSIDRPVRLLDVMPTLLELAEVPAPDGVQGQSLAALWTPGAPVPALPEQFVVETYRMGVDKVGVYAGDRKFIHNRIAHPGTLPRELQPNRILENGKRTDVGAAHPAVRDALADYLQRWEQQHPKATPATGAHQVSEAEAAQLRALGYAQ